MRYEAERRNKRPSAALAERGGAWQLWGLVGGGLLVISLWVLPGREPGLLSPAAAQAESSLTAPPSLPPLDPPGQPAAPVRLSVMDVVGKAALLLLLVYGLGQLITRLRSGSPASRRTRRGESNHHDRVRVLETVVLEASETSLYLLEVDGQTLLVGAGGGSLQTLWTPAPEGTSAFEPVLRLDSSSDRLSSPGETRLETRDDEVRRERPLAAMGMGRSVRREADWARQRSQLINALLDGE